MANWIGHRLVEFGTSSCENCGNTRLVHLHRVQKDDGSVIEVGCECAANLCYSQRADINHAEKLMDKQRKHQLAQQLAQQVRQEKIAQCMKDWKQQGSRWVNRTSSTTIVVHKTQHGWTVKNCPFAPFTESREDALVWATDAIAQGKL